MNLIHVHKIKTSLMALRIIVFLLGCFVLYTPDVKATHIVGGHLTYRCLGNNQYEIRLSLRRDCLLGAPDAQFDDPASIGFFDAVTNQPLTFVGFGGQLFMNFNADDTLNQIFVSDCAIATDPVCVHQTTYVDTIFLPFWANGYKMVYQRCCRNSSVLNIFNPLLTGMTLVSELSATAQTVCKSSPQIGAYPPIYICVNKDIDYFLPATDSQGDSLVFRLATPFAGGDIINNMPQPPNPPPYDLVVWRPPYSLANVMGGIPLNIDPVTGHITGRPNTIGQFIITIVIEAYRNGNKLTETRVDFQYNVRDCRDVPVADFTAPDLTCDGLTVNFQNTSLNADVYKWYFDYGNPQTDSSSAESPIYTYDDEGFYNVALIVRDSMDICADTIIKQIGVFNSNINAEFSYSSNSCSDSITLDFFDLSSSPNYPIVSWEWLITHPTGVLASTEQNPSFTFDIEGISTVFAVLIVTDSAGCTASVAKSFPVQEINLPFNPEADSICLGESVHLLINGDSTLTYTWDPPNGLNINDPWDPIAFPGISVTYYVTVTDGVCTITDSIHVGVQQLRLGFTYETDCNDLTVDFTNTSTGGFQFHWDFGDTSTQGDTSILNNPSYTYPLDGIYIVTLSSRDGCDVSITDTITTVAIQDSLPDQTVNCFQNSAPLNPDGNPDYNYVWEPSEFLDDATSPNPFATIDDDTWFFVTITDPNLPDCEFKDSILLIIPDDFNITAVGDITSCDFKEVVLTATLTGNQNVTIVWTDEDGTEVGTGLQIVVLPQVTTTYTVTATDTLGCSKSDQVTVFKPEPGFEVVATNDSTYCYVQPITLTVVSVPPQGVTFEWFSSTGESIGTGPSVTVTPEAFTCYHVIGTDALGCQAADTVCLSPTYFELTISTDDEMFCDDEGATLTVNAIDGVTYAWFDENNLPIGTGTEVFVSPADPRCYYVVGTDALGCQDADTACVTPVYFDASITGDNNICLGDQTTLCVVDNAGQTLTYLWSTAETTDCIQVQPTVETTYFVTVTNETLGCKDTLSHTVGIYMFDPPVIVITADPDSIYLGQTSQLTVNQSPDYIYDWSSSTGEIVSPVYNPVVTPTGSTTYTVTVTDEHGCTGTASISIGVADLFCDERDIFIPNAFTPDNNGTNDFFKVISNYDLVIDMHVYNRWGQEVFTSKDMNIGWDGTFKGEQLQPDVFGFYVDVTCPNGEKYFKKGNVTLLR
jgi:gliding motility-associated-like protein